MATAAPYLGANNRSRRRRPKKVNYYPFIIIQRDFKIANGSTPLSIYSALGLNITYTFATGSVRIEHEWGWPLARHDRVRRIISRENSFMISSRPFRVLAIHGTIYPSWTRGGYVCRSIQQNFARQSVLIDTMWVHEKRSKALLFSEIETRHFLIPK